MKKLLNKRQSEFVNSWKKAYPNAAEDVLTFIAEFKCRINPHEEEIIESLFSAGYCYYFAKMLEDAFGGMIMYSADRGHIVWLDNRDTKYWQLAYDIHGIYEDYERLLPVSEQSYSFMECYRHRGKDYDLDLAIIEFQERHGLTEVELDDKVFSIIPLKQRLCPYGNREDTCRYFSEYVDESEYKGYNLRERSIEEYSTFKARPYDDADYYWAKTCDKWNWEIVYKGKIVQKDFVGSFRAVVDLLESYNSQIKAKIMHN